MSLPIIESIPMEYASMTAYCIGLDVIVNILSANPKEKKYGELIDYDETGIYVKIGAKGKPKKFPYEGSAFCIVQEKRGIMFETQSQSEKDAKAVREAASNQRIDEFIQSVVKQQKGGRKHNTQTKSTQSSSRKTQSKQKKTTY